MKIPSKHHSAQLQTLHSNLNNVDQCMPQSKIIQELGMLSEV